MLRIIPLNEEAPCSLITGSEISVSDVRFCRPVIRNQTSPLNLITGCTVGMGLLGNELVYVKTGINDTGSSSEVHLLQEKCKCGVF